MNKIIEKSIIIIIIIIRLIALDERIGLKIKSIEIVLYLVYYIEQNQIV